MPRLRSLIPFSLLISFLIAFWVQIGPRSYRRAKVAIKCRQIFAFRFGWWLFTHFTPTTSFKIEELEKSNWNQLMCIIYVLLTAIATCTAPAEANNEYTEVNAMRLRQMCEGELHWQINYNETASSERQSDGGGCSELCVKRDVEPAVGALVQICLHCGYL